MESSVEKLAANEAVFREVNERVAETAGRFTRAGAAPEFDFLCECADVGCVTRITLSMDEYAHVRSKPTWFVIVPGHEVDALETVVERRGRYEIVEKTGDAAAVAIALDR